MFYTLKAILGLHMLTKLMSRIFSFFNDMFIFAIEYSMFNYTDDNHIYVNDNELSAMRWKMSPKLWWNGLIEILCSKSM